MEHFHAEDETVFGIDRDSERPPSSLLPLRRLLTVSLAVRARRHKAQAEAAKLAKAKHVDAVFNFQKKRTPWEDVAWGDVSLVRMLCCCLVCISVGECGGTVVDGSLLVRECH
jgi:hypothetical protein